MCMTDMDHEEYISQVKEGLIAKRFEKVPPNNVFNLETENTFLGFTLSEKKEVKEYLSMFTAFVRTEDRPSPQDNIYEFVVIALPDANTAEIREDPDTSATAEIRNVCTLLSNEFESINVDTDKKLFLHMLFVTDNGTKHMKTAIKENKIVNFPDFGILPVLADIGNETLTYNTENEGAKGIVGTAYTEQLNERTEKYFSVSE